MHEKPAMNANIGTTVPWARAASLPGPHSLSVCFQQNLRRVLATLLLAIPVGLWAQSADIAGQEKAAESDEASQHVEESEEAFRRRMETADSHDQSDVMRPRSSGTNKVPEGIDALPADSRKHLRDELRNVIIEQGEWKPEDAGKVYPYTPSAAAENDPQLRQQEQEAWGELVQEYHKREAAALAMGGGRGGSGESDEQRKDSSAGSSGAGSARKSSDPSERSATEAAGSTAAGAGVSQSALEFLKRQQGGTGGQPAAGASDTSGAIAAASRPQGASPGQPPGQPQDQAQSQPPQNAAAQAAADKPAENEQKKEPEEPEAPKPPPGSLAIAELAALEESARREAEAQSETSVPSQASADSADNDPQQVAAMKQQSSEQPPPLPGTIAIPELEKLQGMEEAPPLAAKEPESEP
jgi:hypothetical protein